ncbi:MAG: hypothetical protein EOO38_12240 [Cytophagaceae bacterium]|nr:MAG: hypothetical protein EOO38_12240 [Cytophagaceae bacterium]
MKNKFLMLMFLLSTQAFLVNCAKSSDNNAQAAAAVGIAGQCGVGAVSTQYGCLPQSVNGQCQVGYGYSPQYGCVAPTYNQGIGQQCGVGAVSTQYGCLPQSVNGQCQVGYGYSPQYGCVAPSYNNGGVGGTCQAGYVGTVVGCLPQGSCPMNYGFYAQTTYQQYQSPTGFCFYRSY